MIIYNIVFITSKEKSYETIRLAFIDPQSRIKSQAEYDSLTKAMNTIDNLKNR